MRFRFQPLLLCFLASCLLSSGVFAQVTSVTGTITDPNGIPYAGAQIKAQLVLAGGNVTGQPTVTVTGAQRCLQASFGASPCQVPFIGTVGPFTADQNGAFSLSLQDNNLVTPAGTQWLFSVTISPGVPLPLGTGPQSCSATITITGAAQNVTASFSCPLLSIPGIGGGAAAGVLGDVQLKGSPGFAVGGANDNGTLFRIDRDVQTKGPNPEIDVTQYGGYASGFVPPSTTGSISAASASLAVAAAQDFANNQGVVVWQAGAACTLTTPGTPTVTPTGILNGVTTWGYKVIAEGRDGCLTAASVEGTTAVGAATLGVNTVSLTNAATANGITTYTSAAAHNIQAGSTVKTCGFGSAGCPAAGDVNNVANGVKIVVATPTGSTFTTDDGSATDVTTSTGAPQVLVEACNKLTFVTGSYSGNNTLRYWIYRRQGAGSFTLVGVAIGLDPFFVDCNRGNPTAPGYVPATPPGASQPGYLSTIITAGGGTTTLTLRDAAISTVSNQTVLHDNTQPARLAIQTAYNNQGAKVVFPSQPVANLAYVFNSTLDLTTGFTTNGLALDILGKGQLIFSQPFIGASNVVLEGVPANPTSFQTTPGIAIGGSYPIVYVNTVTSFTMRNLKVVPSNNQAVGVYADLNSSGGGSAGMLFDNIGAGPQAASGASYVLKGGFNWFFKDGVCTAVTAFPVPPCILFTNSSPAVVGSNSSQIPGFVFISGTQLAGSGIVSDCAPNSFFSGSGSWTLEKILQESTVYPVLTLRCVQSGQQFELSSIQNADPVSGGGTPLIETSQTFGYFVKFDASNGAKFPPIPPVINGICAANAVPNPVVITSAFVVNSVTTGPPTVRSCSFEIARGLVSASLGVVARGSGYFGYSLTPPSQGPGIVVSAGGAVPVGGFSCQITFTDFNNVPTTTSPNTACNTSLGNQTVQWSLPASIPPGAVGWIPYLNGGSWDYNAVTGSCLVPLPITTLTFTSGNAFGCGVSRPNVNNATNSGIDSAGVYGNAGPVSGQWTCTNVVPVTVSASVTTDQNLMSCAIPFGVLNRLGRTLRVHAAGVYSTPAASTAQMTVKFKLCAVSGCGSGTVISPISIQTTALGGIQVTNDNWSATGYVTTQTAGATASFEPHGNFTIDLTNATTGADSVFGDTNTATVGTVDTTAQLFLQVTFAFSAASASNSATQRQLVVETIN